MSIECSKFHETKRERKKYEDKKQKALRKIDQVELELKKMINTQSILDISNRNKDMLISEIHDKLRDIAFYVNEI